MEEEEGSGRVKREKYREIEREIEKGIDGR